MEWWGKGGWGIRSSSATSPWWCWRRIWASTLSPSSRRCCHRPQVLARGAILRMCGTTAPRTISGVMRMAPGWKISPISRRFRPSALKVPTEPATASSASSASSSQVLVVLNYYRNSWESVLVSSLLSCPPACRISSRIFSHAFCRSFEPDILSIREMLRAMFDLLR